MLNCILTFSFTILRDSDQESDQEQNCPKYPCWSAFNDTLVVGTMMEVVGQSLISVKVLTGRLEGASAG